MFVSAALFGFVCAKHIQSHAPRSQQPYSRVEGLSASSRTWANTPRQPLGPG